MNFDMLINYSNVKLFIYIFFCECHGVYIFLQNPGFNETSTHQTLFDMTIIEYMNTHRLFQV